jgi:hypothetical protein
MQEHAPFAEAPIGVVTHYWSHLGVAGVHLTAPLDVGDRIHIHGHTSDFEQRVNSIEIDHATTPHADANADVGLEVADHVREHDMVYRLIELADMGANEAAL